MVIRVPDGGRYGRCVTRPLNPRKSALLCSAVLLTSCTLESGKASRIFTVADLFINFETGFQPVGIVDLELNT